MIHLFENEKQLNIFNPKYKYYIYEDMVDLNFDEISKFILNLEKSLSHIKSSNLDGGTGLGDKSLTSKHSFYNLLSFKEMKQIKSLIRKHNKKFLSLLNTTYDKFYVKCFEDLDKIRKILEGKTFKKYYSENYPNDVVDEFWGELCEIYSYSTAQLSYEYKRLTEEKYGTSK